VLKTLGGLLVGAAAGYVAVRVVEQHRIEKRLSTPVTSWPDVPTDAPAPPAPGSGGQLEGDHHPGATSGPER
jgi:hypothetical protein